MTACFRRFPQGVPIMERRTGAKSRAQLCCSVVVEGRKERKAEREGICALYAAATARRGEVILVL